MDLLKTTIANDMLTLSLLLVCLGSLMILNIILGGVMANEAGTFDKATFWRGVKKAILVFLVMVVFSLILEVTPIILARIEMQIPADLPTYMEVIAIVIVSYVKYAKGIVDKLKTLLGLTEADEAKVEEIEKAHVKDEETVGEG